MPVRTLNMPNSLDETLAAPEKNGVNGDASKPSTKQVEKSAPTSLPPLHEAQATYAPSERKAGITFASQDKLPKLPIPDLEQSCRKYLAALKPLQSSREHADTAATVDEFLKGEGPELQERLKRYATGRTSYIEQFWYDSYLNFDNPVVLNLNPFFLLEDDPTPHRNNQVTRAASLAISSLAFVRAVRKEELAPDTIRGAPLCMYQYSRLFGTARVPTENGCIIGQDANAKHIVVMARGQFYWFDVLDDNSDLIFTEKDMSLNLQAIVDDAQMTPIEDAAKGALGVLSTENRKIWAGLRDILTRDEGSNNADCLAIVDSALFILCLDYTQPQSGPDLCMNMLCGSSKVERGIQIGTCTNRWYDKLQIIVCANGSAGINFEHTGVDGHTVLRMASDVYTDTILRFARTINGQAPSLWASSSPDPSKRDPSSFGDVNTTPHKLQWTMGPELSTALRFAETRLADLIQQNEFETLNFAGYGKNFMTGMGFSPDAFVQMAFQAAYYGLYGRHDCVYEPAMTKTFFHGRTEAVRAVTQESTDFVQAFWTDIPPIEKVEALKKACQQHTAITKESAKAQGQDRHLYALFSLWQRAMDNEEIDAYSADGRSSPDAFSDRSLSPSFSSPGRRSISSEDLANHTNGRAVSTGGSRSSRAQTPQQMPALFADAGWDKLNNTILSTSNCGNPCLRQFGFGPTSGEGFGIGYIIKDDSIAICASSKHRQTKRFVDAIESYLLEMRKLLRQTQQRRGTSGTKGSSRAREAEGPQRPTLATRLKSRGTLIPSVGGKGVDTPTDNSSSRMESEEEELLGGYGFFDAGMLKQALKAGGHHHEDRERPSEKAVGNARRSVGKRLRLADF